MSARRVRSPYFWEEAPFLRPVAALIAGIIWYELARPASEARWFLYGAAPLLLALLAIAGTRRAPGKALAACQQALVPFFFISLGLLASATQDQSMRPAFPAGVPDGPTICVVSAEPRLFETGQSLTVQLLYSLDTGRIQSSQAGARVACYNDSSGAPAFQSGDTLLLRGTWERFQASGNPFEPDLGAAMRRKGCYFRMQTGAAGVRRIGRRLPESRSVLQRIHDACAVQLDTYIPNRRAFGLIQAMLLGDEGGFDPMLRGLYADTGIIHIVSISGSHVAMLFAVIAGLLRWIPGERGAWIRYGVGLLLVWLYVLVAGAPPSALRSAVMFSVVALSTMSKREGRGLNTLCTAAVILLVAEPAWLFAPGFQLSFAAVLSLMLFYQPLQRLIPVRIKPLRWLWQAICASIAAEILTAPIVIWYFHSFPLMFIPANLLAGVVIGAGGLIGGMLVILFSPATPLARAIGQLLGWMLDLTNEALRCLQRFSPESFRHLYLSDRSMFLMMMTILLLGIAWLQKSHRALLAAMATVCVMLGLNLLQASESRNQARIIVYNNGRQALIDAIAGQRFTSLSPARTDYHALPARTALGAWREAPDTARNPLFRFKDKRIMIVTDSELRMPAGTLPVDVLILTQAARRLRIANALSCFQPKTLVLGSRFSPWREALWADSCRAHRIRFHAISTMGAWTAD